MTTPLCAHFGYTGSLSCSCQCCLGTCGHAAQWFWQNRPTAMYPAPSFVAPHQRCDCHDCTQARARGPNCGFGAFLGTGKDVDTGDTRADPVPPDTGEAR